MQGPAKPLYGGSIPPLASILLIMKLKFNLDTIYFLLIEKRLIAILLAMGILLVIVAISGVFYFSQKQKSKISAQIAIGFANLEAGRNEIALIYFQDAFNQSSGLYGVIAGSGIIRSLNLEEQYNAKAQNILTLIKDYKSPTFIKMFVIGSYLGNVSHFAKSDFNKTDFTKLEEFANKKQGSFQQITQNISLNLNNISFL
jgi:hypothetical protein